MSLEIVFVKSYYDGPLSGLARLDGELGRFEFNFDKEDYDFYPLSFSEKISEWLNMKLFEICVGYHMSYYRKSNRYFHWRRPVCLHYIMFKTYYFFNKPKRGMP